MAFAFQLRLPPPQSPSTTSTTSLRRTPPPLRFSTTTAATTKSDVALLWFKHDLRLDDHPALITSASNYHSVLPLYIFDHRIISRFSDETLEIALLALKDMKCLLEEQGSNLMIRFGNAESVISEIVKEVNKLGLNQNGGIDVFAEEEVEYKLRGMIDSVEKCLADLSLLQGRTKMVHWRTPFYDIEHLEKLPTFYSDIKRLNISQTSPLASLVLPHLDIDLDWGGVPTLDEVKAYCMSVTQLKLKEDWASLKKASARSVLSKIKSSVEEGSGKSNPSEGSNMSIARRKSENSVFISREGTVVGGGTRVVLNALAAYLRYLEGTSRYDWQEVHEKLRNAESRSGASFGALFRSALSLGIISRRKVFYESIKYERERNGGFLSPFGYSSPTAAAAADTVASMEWYWLMALKSQSDKLRRHPNIWRWNDYLIQYTVVGEGPATLLVHGFGAFLEHYRDNLTPLADAGNRVWTLTLLGFGKSEKPNVVYTELMWAELLRDFIVDVVGEPVHLIGNSIGGYFVAIVAGLWPALAKSILLINTAGSVLTGNSSVLVKEERKVSTAAWLGSRGLLFYLKSRVGNIVKNCYPTNKERADDWLINEMLRAADDPGVLVVLESVFSFNLSIPLNYLFESFGGKVLIIQGMKDPLSNSESKLLVLREHCKGIEIRELDAGHCPHDERPEEVNALICEWIVKLEKSLQNC
ncbi:hypothetical protein ACHQM5_001251 [Ranunculus cassubicifolius]